MNPESTLEQKLIAILHADVVGYSRLSGTDELGTHRTLSEYLDAMASLIRHHFGRVVNYAGDAVLAEFDRVSNAPVCALLIRQDLARRNAGLPEDRQVHFRIGINLGEVIVDHDDIFGDGVNVAARLESLAEPDGVVISEAVHDAIGSKLPLDYEYLGEKNVIRKAMALNPFYTYDYPYNLGRAEYTLGRYEDAVKLLREALDRNEAVPLTRMFLAASLVQLDRLDDAEWEVVQLQAANPGITTTHLADIGEIADPALLQRFLDDLRKAGLPD